MSTIFTRGEAPLFSPSAMKPVVPAAMPSASLQVNQGSELADSNIDWSRVYRIRERVTAQLAENARITEASNEDRRQYSRTIIPSQVVEFSDQAVREGRNADVIHPTFRRLYERAVEEAIFGYGRWTPLMEDPDVENIELRNHRGTFMVYGDRIDQVANVADSDQELIDQVQHLATYMASTPKVFSITNPAITLNLGDRFRLHAVGFDITGTGPSIVIRQHKHVQVALPDLVELGMMPAHVADFLAAAMVAGRSILISGAQGAGKTTMARALAAALPPMRAIGVIESDPELFLHQLPGRYRVINLLARDGSTEALGPNGRPAGEVALDRLLKESKRQNLSMVSVGEILGAEAAVLFEAMQSGVGSFSTIHSDYAAATIERVVTAAAQGGVLTTEDAYRQVGTLMNFVVHIGTTDLRHLPGGRFERHVEEIIEISGFKEDGQGGLTSMPAWQTVYSSADPNAALKLTPRMESRLRKVGWKGGQQ